MRVMYKKRERPYVTVRSQSQTLGSIKDISPNVCRLAMMSSYCHIVTPLL